ncbi:Gfo/Idh/MocA family protein [Mariniphaga sediminis]|uniref:Gfo/Idh/MocA family protein n=1 Tax=Mariniphaga sediminis TaxID=1628158 RepID=UPI003566829E
MKSLNRRKFIKNTATISSLTLLAPSVAFGSKANSAIRLGIIGCGNRGTSVLRSMSKYTNTSIIAMGDLFRDRLEASKKILDEQNKTKGFLKIAQSATYTGTKSYEQVLDNKDVDAVLISTPAYAHPEILEAAIDAGKHVYCEKPAATDVDGCKRILKVSKTANDKLSVVMGFQIRYATPYVEMAKRIQRGDIGEIISVQLYYFSSEVPLKPIDGMSFDEARIRNHFHFNELSGGILLDQGIHMIDVCNWILQSKPLHAIGLGGQKGCLEFGNTWTNYQVIYKYPNDVNVTVQSTQVGQSFGDVCARFVGTKGIAEAHYTGGVFIKGENEWDSGIVKSGDLLTPEQIATGSSLSSLDDADKNKGKSFIESIETGSYLNQLQSGSESTLSAVLGREAAIRQELVTWDEIYFSSKKIDPQLNLNQFNK